MADVSEKFKQFVEEVRSKCSIVDIISEDTQLEKRGKTLFCLSNPLRTESDPSFAVYPETESWYDFGGGGYGGDIFFYIQKKHNCEFVEAVKILAEKVGIEPYWGDESDENHQQQAELYKERREIERVLTIATAHYHKCLTDDIRETYYHKKYGFTDETINELQLGWTTGDLYEELLKLGIDKKTLLKTGLFVKIKNGSIKDFFVNRLFFPYWYRGRVVYTIGRRTELSSDEDWDKAKYKKLLTNSDNHPYVSEAVSNEWFYNEDCVIHGTNRLIITEGVTDCISARQAGFACISPVTTRFREKDIPKLISLCSKTQQIIICNDSDILPDGSRPGEQGAQKTALALYKENKDVRIASLPRPEDVTKVDLNEFLLDHTPQELEDVFNLALSYPEFLINKIDDTLSIQQQSTIYEQLCDLICNRSELEIERFASTISEKFKLPKAQVKNAINKSKKKQEEQNKQEQKEQKEEKKRKRQEIDEQIRGKLYSDIDFYYVNYVKNGTETTDIISSFRVVTKYKIKLDRGSVVLLAGDIISTNDKTINNFIFPKNCWVGKKEFIKSLPDPDLMWTGTDDNVQYLMQSLSAAEVPVYKGTENLGYYEDNEGRRWVSSKNVISPEGIMDKPNITYAGGYSSLDGRLIYENSTPEELKEVASTVLPQLIKTNDPSVIMPILGWCFATPFKPRIQEILGHFPILMIWGTHGSGKTSIIRDVFWPMFGVAKKTDPYSVTETDFAMMKLQSSTNSIFVFLDEYRPNDMGKIKVEKLHRALRRAYGGETEERGRTDLSIVTYKLEAPIILAGETKPETDPALMERMICVHPDKNSIRNANIRESFNIIKSTKVHKLATEIIKYSLEKEDDQIKEELKKARKITERELSKTKGAVPIRCFDNMAVITFGLLQFDSICEKLGVSVDHPNVEDIYSNMKKELLQGEDTVKDSFDRFLESLTVFAQTGNLTEGTHYAYVDGTLNISIPMCYHVYLTERKRAGLDDETNGVNALKTMAKENMARSGYVLDVGKQVKMKDGKLRCVCIDPDKVPDSFEFERFPMSRNRAWGGTRANTPYSNNTEDDN